MESGKRKVESKEFAVINPIATRITFNDILY